MKLLSWDISSVKQDNGLWGMPMNCIYLDAVVLENLDEVKRSAIYAALAESYPYETYEVRFSSKDGFLACLSKSGPKYIKFDNYELRGNSLFWLK